MKKYNTFRLVLGILIALISGKRIITPTVKARLALKREEWNKTKNEIQTLLDEEHSKGRGIMLVDGRVKHYEPFTSQTVRGEKPEGPYLAWNK